MGAPDRVGLPRAGFAAVAGIVAAAIVFVVVVAGLVPGFAAVAVATVVAILGPAVVATEPGRRFAVELATVTPAIVFTGSFAGAIAGAGSGFAVVVGVVFIVGVGAGLATDATTGPDSAFVGAGFGIVVRGGVAPATCFVAVRGATATAPDSTVEAVTRPELEPPAFALRNDQPGFAVLAAANACFAGLTTAGAGFAAGVGVVFPVVVAGGIADAFGPEETTGRAAVVRSMRSALVGGSARTVAGALGAVALGFVEVTGVAVVVGFAVVVGIATGA